MDVLNCGVINVNGRCYRVPEPSPGLSSRYQQPAQYYDEDEESYPPQQSEDEVLIDDSLITQENNMYVTRISCDPEVFPFVIGKGNDPKHTSMRMIWDGCGS